jgi:hypothetical protein
VTEPPAFVSGASVASLINLDSGVPPSAKSSIKKVIVVPETELGTTEELGADTGVKTKAGNRLSFPPLTLMFQSGTVFVSASNTKLPVAMPPSSNVTPLRTHVSGADCNAVAQTKKHSDSDIFLNIEFPLHCKIGGFSSTRDLI